MFRSRFNAIKRESFRCSLGIVIRIHAWWKGYFLGFELLNIKWGRRSNGLLGGCGMLGIHMLVLESFPSRFLVSSIRHSLFYYLYMGVLILIERRGSSDSLLRGRSKALVVMILSYSLFLERRSVLFLDGNWIAAPLRFLRNWIK